MIEQQISGYVEACKVKLGPEAGVDETRQCLAPAMELNPEHSLVMEMIHTAQMHEEERKFMAEQKRATDAKAARGAAHYQKAMSIYKKGQLAKAIAEFEKFLKTPYPRSESLKDQANRQIASITKELKSKVDFLYDQCKALGGKNRYKEAYLSCDKAANEDPGNSEVKEFRDRMHSELRREMKAIYEDSVLEESLGNVDTAKEKWKKIMQENLDFDDYTKKARSKLQKYGVDF
ncbi:MAG: hypothetical protein HC902_07440 [Calothrix sp. SM1_5_4]|nr:hypothetical protein [Calothrix sp. SM1_5_4]